MSEICLTYLARPNVKELNLTNEEILNAIETCLKAQGNAETVIEPRVHLVAESSDKGHFNILRGYIKPMGVAGFKIVGVFVDHYKQGLPSEMALLNLFSLETGLPKAVVDATSITDMRTGAVTALSAKYLARTQNKILGHVGARGTAYWNVRMLDHPYDFAEIRVHSRRPKSRGAFGEWLSNDLGKNIIVTDNWQECLEGGDIIVEASRLLAPEPLFKTSWVKKGAFVVRYGTMSAVEFSPTDIMDKIVVDDWGQCKPGEPYGSLRRHVDEGKLTEDNLHAEMGQIVAGHRPGRESDEETNLFWHRGLSITDVALGMKMLEKAAKMGIGQQLRFA